MVQYNHLTAGILLSLCMFSTYAAIDQRGDDDKSGMIGASFFAVAVAFTAFLSWNNTPPSTTTWLFGSVAILFVFYIIWIKAQQSRRQKKARENVELLRASYT